MSIRKITGFHYTGCDLRFHLKQIYLRGGEFKGKKLTFGKQTEVQMVPGHKGATREPGIWGTPS